MADFKALAAPFSPAVVSWRVGSMNKEKTRGMALAYIDARDVMERLDTVCGVAGWQCRYSHANGKTVCDIGIRCGDEWIWKADGAGDSDIEAEKGALSDAFKRAAVRWGIGRYLYDLPSPWVELDEWKRIKESERKRLIQSLSSSWGPRGPSGAVADAHADGLTAKAPDIKPEVLERAKARVTRDIGTIRLSGQTAETLHAFWKANERSYTAISEHVPAEYERLRQAFDDALDAARARAA